MKRRRFLQGIGAAGTSLLLNGCNGLAEMIGKRKKNVLLIMVDDLNDWCGCMGGHPQAITPNIDALAQQGTLFTNAHCPAPICGPSRAAMMMSLRPASTGIYGQIEDQYLQQDNPYTADAVFLPNYFQQHGYKTLGVGKLFHQGGPKGAFEEYGGAMGMFGPYAEKRFKYDPKWFGREPLTSTDWAAFPESDDLMPDYKIAHWAVERLQQQHDKPFFFGVGFIRPHVPWYVPQKWHDLYKDMEIITPPYLPTDMNDIPEIGQRVAEVPMMPTTEWAISEGEWANAVQAYLACASFVDHYVGMVLDTLRAGPYADNTVIALCGDHGYHLGEKNRFAKHSLWQRATNTPLIFAGPGIGRNEVCPQPASLMDIYPTLTDICALPANQQCQGHSLSPLLRDARAPWKHHAVVTYGRNNHAVCSEHYRYIHYEDGSEELYDRRRDPNEWTNIAGHPGYAEVKQRLAQSLPKVNRPWTKHSAYQGYRFFVEQKQRDAGT